MADKRSRRLYSDKAHTDALAEHQRRWEFMHALRVAGAGNSAAYRSAREAVITAMDRVHRVAHLPKSSYSEGRLTKSSRLASRDQRLGREEDR